MALLRLLRECDLFRKLPTEHREADAAPETAIVLVLRALTVVLIGFLALSETWTFLTPVRKQRFDLDQGDSAADAVDGRILAPKKLRVLLDVTVHGFPCIDLSLDYQDVMGTRNVDVRNTIFKQRLYKNGTAVPEAILANDPRTAVKGSPSQPSLFKGAGGNSSCKSCYGALPDGECCNTCSDVLYAYRLKRWALPRIEDIEQCRHDGSAKSAYQPPQIIRLGEYSSEDYLPKFTKLTNLQTAGKEPRITTPFKLNLTLAPLKPLKIGTGLGEKSKLPFTLNFSSGADDDFDEDWGDDDDLFGDLEPRSKDKKEKKEQRWPDCVQRNTIIHGYDIGEALMIDLAKHGAKEGCWNDDCKETDKFTCDSIDSCSTMCDKVDACQWWTWGDEAGVKKCWIRSGKHGREKRYGFSSGPRACTNVNTTDSSTTVAASSSSESSSTLENASAATEVTSGDSSAQNTSNTSGAGDSSEGFVDTQGRRLSGIPESFRAQPRRLYGYDDDLDWIGRAQPRRLSFFDDDLDGLGRPEPFTLNLGPSPHMPLFGGTFDSPEKEARRQQKDESCRLYGYFDTNKVPGNFHIGTHGTMAPSYLSYFDEPAPTEQNMRHTINQLAFVEIATNATLMEKQPLDGFESPKAFTFQYYLTVNPASIRYPGDSVDGYQYRAGSFVTNELIGPAVFFRLDIDPIRVTYYEQEVRSSKFLLNLCAIVGGCIAMCSMIAQFFETAAHCAVE